MIEKTKCKSCAKVYELIWDDAEIDDWQDDFEDDDYQSFDDEDVVYNDDPAYCPFCGSHVDFDE